MLLLSVTAELILICLTTEVWFWFMSTQRAEVSSFSPCSKRHVCTVKKSTWAQIWINLKRTVQIFWTSAPVLLLKHRPLRRVRLTPCGVLACVCMHACISASVYVCVCFNACVSNLVQMIEGGRWGADGEREKRGRYEGMKWWREEEWHSLTAAGWC